MTESHHYSEKAYTVVIHLINYRYRKSRDWSDRKMVRDPDLDPLIRPTIVWNCPQSGFNFYFVMWIGYLHSSSTRLHGHCHIICGELIRQNKITNSYLMTKYGIQKKLTTKTKNYNMSNITIQVAKAQLYNEKIRWIGIFLAWKRGLNCVTNQLLT